MATVLQGWTSTGHRATTTTGTSPAMAAGPTHQTSTIAPAFHTHTLSSIHQPSTISALRTHPGRHPTPIKRRLAIRTPTPSASPEYGRWPTWPARKTAKTNHPTSQRILATPITRRPARFSRRWLHEASTHCTILTCARSSIEASTARPPRTWPATPTTLQFSSLINEPSALRSPTTACRASHSAQYYRRSRRLVR